MQTNLLILGRVLLASLFLISGVRKILGWAGTLAFMQSKGLPYADILLMATIALEIGAALLIAVNILAAPAAILLAGFCLVAAVIFHNFWAVPDAQFANQLNHFLKNVALAGGLLAVAGTSASARS